MSLDFREGVLKEYQAKRADGSLSPNLVTPTPASIRDECLLIFANKRKSKDVNIVKMFVGNREDSEEYERALRIVDITKFKPLQNFLLDPAINTAYRNIELLAWLIDFEPNKKPAVDAPDTRDTLDRSDEEELEVLNDGESRKVLGGSGNSVSATLQTRKLTSTLKDLLVNHNKKVLVVIALLFTAGVAITVKSPKDKSFLSLLKPSSQCMYWNEDHYEEIDCETKPPFGQAVAIDNFKLKYFKKITSPDTLTLNDINKVWYLKSNNQLELYTADGDHPEQYRKRLRPLTKYMFDKYVSEKKVLAK